MTTFGDMLYGLGGVPAVGFGPGNILLGGGRIFFVDPASGNDSNDGLTLDSPLANLSVAYAKTTSGNHDTVVLVGTGTTTYLSETLTWANSYTHLIGVAAPTGVSGRARIAQLSTATGVSPLINITGTGCVFSNLQIFQGVNDATSLINVQVTGGRNYFESIHFAGGGHATMAINDGASLKIDGAEECLFRNCTIGLDTISSATGHVGLLFDGAAHRIKFEDCYFTMYAGHAASGFVEVADSTGIDRYNMFKNCQFLNTSGTAMTSAFLIPAGMGAPRRMYVDKQSMLHGATDWDASDRGVLLVAAGTVTAGGNAGIYQASTAA